MKRAKPKLEKKPSVSALKKKLDTVFSVYIRMRDGEYRKGVWWCRCITCGEWKPLKIMQAGHFQSRRFTATRFHEQNVHAQCKKCNIFNQGEQYKYAIAVDRLYGTGTADMLEQLARQTKKFKTWELEEMIGEYKLKIHAFERKAYGNAEPATKTA